MYAHSIKQKKTRPIKDDAFLNVTTKGPDGLGADLLFSNKNEGQMYVNSWKNRHLDRKTVKNGIFSGFLPLDLKSEAMDLNLAGTG